MQEWIKETLGYELHLNPIGWSGVSGVADIFMVAINLFLLLTIWHGIRNIRETRKSRDADMMNLVLEQMQAIKPSINELNVKAREGLDWENNEEARRKAHEAMIGLQRVGYLGVSGMINKRHLIEMWGPMFVEQWNRLGPYVRKIRIENGEPPELAEGAFSRKDFEKFARMSSRYLKRHYKAVSRNFSLDPRQVAHETDV